MLEKCNGMISDEAREILIKLAHEMNEKGIYTKCFDIFILRDEQWAVSYTHLISVLKIRSMMKQRK